MPTIQQMLDQAYPSGNQRAAGFIPTSMFPSCQDLDGTAAREFLESNGYEVVANGDLGNNGVAVTRCGWVLSTNGYVYYNAIAAKNTAERVYRLEKIAA